MLGTGLSLSPDILNTMCIESNNGFQTVISLTTFTVYNLIFSYTFQIETCKNLKKFPKSGKSGKKSVPDPNKRKRSVNQVKEPNRGENTVKENEDEKESKVSTSNSTCVIVKSDGRK